MKCGLFTAKNFKTVDNTTKGVNDCILNLNLYHKKPLKLITPIVTVVTLLLEDYLHIDLSNLVHIHKIFISNVYCFLTRTISKIR